VHCAQSSTCVCYIMYCIIITIFFFFLNSFKIARNKSEPTSPSTCSLGCLKYFFFFFPRCIFLFDKKMSRLLLKKHRRLQSVALYILVIILNSPGSLFVFVKKIVTQITAMKFLPGDFFFFF
jgi:hypothetical protein